MITLIDNVLQTIVTIVAATICTTEYVRTRHRSHLYMAMTLWFYVLGIYYWTVYLVVMGNLPDTILFADLAFIASFVFLLPALYDIRPERQRLRIHPVLLPVVLLSLALYVFVYYNYSDPISFAALTCLAGVILYFSLLWFLDAKKEGQHTTIYLTGVVLILCEHACWVCDLFFQTDSLANPYYWFDTLVTACFLVAPFALSKALYVGQKDRESGRFVWRRICWNVLFAMIISAFGVLLGIWLKNSLSGDGGMESEGYIIAVILFAFSVMVVVSILSIMIITGMQMHFRESDALREAKAKAELASEAKSSFLADMSHEIRTPINAVLGMNEMILRESPNDRITTYARNVESAGKNLLSIINDILDFSKIEAGKMEIVEAAYQLSSVLNDVSNMITFRARSKDLAFHVDVDESIPDLLYGDEVRVRQIITNILTNAVKYTLEGSVTLTVRGERSPHLPSSAQQQPPPQGAPPAGVITLVIEVKDTGIGIKKEDLATLFTKFGRVDLEKTKTIEGTGLGLAITENLLLMMQGDIRVKSVYGEGSVFTVRIPQGIVKEDPIGDFHKRFEEGLKTLKTYRESFRAPDAHVLVVDDTELNLVVIEGLLKPTEVKLDLAYSGKEALQSTKDTPYDLILLDQRMPHMNGTQTLAHIRAQEGGCNRETPVICLTADAVQGAKERYLAEGFSDYLSKPVEGSALEASLMKYLPMEKVIRMTEEATDVEMAAKEPQGTGVEQVPLRETQSDNASELEKLYATVGALDYKTARQYLQSDELLGKVLRQFYDVITEKADGIKRCLEAGDYENYTIQVHALKSNARMIGAEELSELARQLEENGNLILKEIYRETFHAPDAHVLVVDDTELNLTVICGLLKETKLQITTAGSGAEAVALAEKTPFDLILMDQRMPGMDGVEAQMKIRVQANGCNCKTPIICLTADAVQGARERYLAEGFTDYLTKPVEIMSLEAALMEHLPQEKMIRIKKEVSERYENGQGKDSGATASSSTGITAGTDAGREQESPSDSKAERFVREKTPELLASLKVLANDLKPFFEKLEEADADLPEMEQDELEELYESIRELCEVYDLDGINHLMLQMQGYRVPEMEQERYAMIKKCIQSSDWNMLKEVLPIADGCQ